MSAEEEYRMLFQSAPCNKLGCDHVADGYITDLCRKHEEEWLDARSAPRLDPQKGKR